MKLPARLEQPAIRDALLAVGLALLVESEILATDVSGPMAALVLLGLAATLPLALRRRAPVAVVAIVVTALIGLDALSEVQEPQITLLAFVLATFSVGAHAARSAALVGLAIALGGVFAVEPGDFVVLGPLLAATLLVGRLVRSHSLQARRLVELTGVLEREQAENARLAIAHERVRIARELHDVVAHSVSVIVVQAGAERLTLGEARPATREVLHGIERTGREALVEMRRLVGVLRRGDEGIELAPQPSLARLDELVAYVRQAGLPVELTVEGAPAELAPGVDVSAYRIVQEALTNTLKHAGRHGRPCSFATAADSSSSRSQTTAPGRRPSKATAWADRNAGADRAPRWQARGRLASGRRLRRARELPARARVTRVLVVDDQPLVRAGLRKIFDADPELEIAGEAPNGLAAVEGAERLRPDVVVMDIRMPVLDGLEATRRLTAATGGERILILTTFDLDEYVYEALRAGASGFMLKDAPPEALIAAVRIVAGGEGLLAPAVTRRVIERFAQLPGLPPEAPAELDELTAREREVLGLLAAGLSNAEIASRLVISDGTAKTHVARVLGKLGLRDRVQAVIFAYEWGLVRPSGRAEPRAG